MYSLSNLRDTQNRILVAGAHQQIIQAILNFDFMSGKTAPSIVGIVSGGKTVHKCFFGPKEILIPTFAAIPEVKAAGLTPNLLLNLNSGNTAPKTTKAFFTAFPDAVGAHIFAEGVCEQDAAALIAEFPDKLIAGPSGVGLLIPGALKLGAIGGIFSGNNTLVAKTSGNSAVICSSGGMVNELIDSLLRTGGAPSFAVSYGGDRFPITSPVEWCLAAEADPQTDAIIYFGELGGQDEYAIAEALENKTLTKPLHVYIAGHFKEEGTPIQFGHAKALVNSPAENAFAKMDALEAAGAIVYRTYDAFSTAIQNLPSVTHPVPTAKEWSAPEEPRRNSLFTAHKDQGSSNDPFVRHILCTILERDTVSDALVDFAEQTFSSLIDHGAEPSGAVNTMITARAGRDMGSALATGILTIGDRFGGAINNAATNWYTSVKNGVGVEDMLESFKQNGGYVPGIGHKKYTIYNNDPRVAILLKNAKQHLKKAVYSSFAESVAKRTTEKKANLILNVDGAVGALLLDLLSEQEHFTPSEIELLLETEFFNSFFIIPRTVGFIGNYLSQRRRDEGLFRLPEDEVFYL